MQLRIATFVKPMIAILAMTMLAVALACASEEEPTEAPTAAPTPTTPAASTPLTVGTEPTATPVPDPSMADLGWMERYLQSPGYDEAWGQPVSGGTFIFGAQRDSNQFTPAVQGCCYTHGCFRGLPWNSLFRIDPWTGDLTAIEGDLAEQWELSQDGETLSLQLHEGVTFFHTIPEESPLPAEYNGGQIAGDEFVCEDVVATFDRLYLSRPEWETRISYAGPDLAHLEGVSCPDGPRGHSVEMHFERPMGKTMGILAGRAAAIMDKDVVAWLYDYGEAEGVAFMDTDVPANFYSMHGTGPFMPTEINLSVSTDFVANPNYWREGLPLLDAYRNVVIKDIGSRFTALATGQDSLHGRGQLEHDSGPG